MLTMLAKLLKVLNSESDPAQIALAFSFSLVSGFLVFFSPLNLIVLLAVFLLRVNLSAYFLGAAFFSLVAYLLDPLFHLIGLKVLTAAPLDPLWTALYNSTAGRLQRFNNSIVMGGLLFAVLAFVPLFLLSNALIRKYREQVLIWVQRTRLMKLFMASRLYSIYQKVTA